MTICCNLAYGFSDLDAYFIALKNLDYTNAKIVADQFEDKQLKKECILLADVLYYSGQKELDLVLRTNEDNSLPNIISKLANGYQILFSNPYTSESFRYFNEAYKLSVKINNEPLIKFSLLSILQVYNFEISQSNDNAKEFLNKYNKVATDGADLYHYKINLLLFYLRDISPNLKIDQNFAKDFEQLMQKFNNNHKFWPNYFSAIGVLHEALNEREKAITLHQRAIESVGSEPFLKYIKFRSLIRLSEIMRVKGNYKSALDYIENARDYVDLSDSIRSNYYINLYASNNYFQLQDYKNAYSKLNKANKQSVQLDYKKNSLEIAHLNVKYQTAEKEKQILVEQQRTRNNRNWLITASIALIFGTSIALLLQKNTSKKRKLAVQQEQIQKQKVATLLKEQELLSIDAMITGQEKERTKVANELHDDLGSLMATVKLHFDNVKVDKKDPAMKNAQKLLEEAYQKIRGMAHSKNSGVMANYGLLPAVKKMAKTISQANALEIIVEDFGLGERLENSMELTIFRILQELITNIIKHSGASRATIQFTQHEDNLNIIVEDNGKGFDMSTIHREKSGMGLGTIEKRIEHLEGSFTVDSVLGKGSSILIDIPV